MLWWFGPVEGSEMNSTRLLLKFKPTSDQSWVVHLISSESRVTCHAKMKIVYATSLHSLRGNKKVISNFNGITK